MPNTLANAHITSIADITLEEIEMLIKTAKALKKSPAKDLLRGKILASCFFEPSTRTRLSFESAICRLGGNYIGFSEAENTSAKKGETLSDSMKVISAYCDALVLRHPLEGAAALASQVASVPVINAGDGSNQHPTQTLLDLFSIKECQKDLEGLRIAFVGDLLHGRTAHSLATAAALYNMRMYFVSPSILMMPDDVCEGLRRQGAKFSFHPTIEEVLPKVDVLYMTRLQKERMHHTLQNPFQLKAKMLSRAKKSLRVLHPLPRVGEIATDVDNTDHAYYFEQAENGLYMRQALLAHILKPKSWKGI